METTPCSSSAASNEHAVVLEVGFYGKLPSHGDFLRRRVSDAFIGVWDGWLQECIAASRSTLGDRWLDVYLTSPAWRFACAPGMFGPAPVVGLMVPSVDRVGRYFPLTLLAELPYDVNVLSATTGFGRFFDSAQQLVIETLAAEHVDLERFDEAVLRLSAELDALCSRPRILLDPSVKAIVNDGGEGACQIPIGSPDQMGAVLEQILSQRLTTLYDPLVIWWTDGSAAVEPSCLIAKGLPDPNAFTALLDGAWTTSHWQSIPARVETEPLAADTEALVEDLTPPRYRSAGATDVGRVRSVNQDSLLERTEVGLWAVADGLGGHVDGEVASRMVCDALADFVPDASFEQMIDAAGQRLHEVNDHLVRVASRSGNGSLSGSTVVALMTRGSRCAVLWVGDSRVYRMRDGQLVQLTRDHSLVESEGLTTGPSNVITRAVGGEATLTIDLYRDRVRAGDRFLLCSDGLTKIVPEAEVQRWVEHQDIRAGVEGLIATTLNAGAPDNVTVLIVEAYS
jgi:type VI secretion system protein ImpM